MPAVQTSLGTSLPWWNLSLANFGAPSNADPLRRFSSAPAEDKMILKSAAEGADDVPVFLASLRR